MSADFFSKPVSSLLLPCPACRENSGRRPNSFCDECLGRLPFIGSSAPLCPGCGGVLDSSLARCSQCLMEPERPWEEAYSVLVYCGCARELIRRFKFGNCPELARPLGYLLADRITECNIGAELIVPVPLHFMRELRRGYNQAGLLAEIAGKQCGISRADILIRRSFRSRQSGRNRKERHRDLTGIFKLRNGVSLAGKRVLLVDDIFTTGATLHAAAEALQAAGPETVTVLTLARAKMNFSVSNIVL